MGTSAVKDYGGRRSALPLHMTMSKVGMSDNDLLSAICRLYRPVATTESWVRHNPAANAASASQQHRTARLHAAPQGDIRCICAGRKKPGRKHAQRTRLCSAAGAIAARVRKKATARLQAAAIGMFARPIAAASTALYIRCVRHYSSSRTRERCAATALPPCPLLLAATSASRIVLATAVGS